MNLLMRWPLPALLSWGGAWLSFVLLQRLGLPALPALALAAVLGGALALLHEERWRRLMVALGFPMSMLLAGGASGWPAWAWLLPLGLLLLAYPRRSWGDAPLFPTPLHALRELSRLAPLPPGARVLDAGCGLGHGLRELRRAYPQAQIEGVEWSALLALLARLRCPWARIRRGDMWQQSWQDLALLYVFQRPESMERIWTKARQELPAGAWLASLDFEIPGQVAAAELPLGGRHRLWLYRLPAQRHA